VAFCGGVLGQDDAAAGQRTDGAGRHVQRGDPGQRGRVDGGERPGCLAVFPMPIPQSGRHRDLGQVGQVVVHVGR
jgi:hypothetical protein